ncbi:MAG TPA: hypothetical protein VHA52_11545 [Candidatus Babeliaceae bacterium]|nr:hypothetical protein [Candidatus Babeliaceae bacterium]
MVIVACLMLIVSIASSLLANNAQSHSWFTIPPVYQSGMPIKESLFRNDVLCGSCSGFLFDDSEYIGGALEVVPFGSESTEPEELARYFFPFDLSSIVVAEDKAKDVSQRDVDASHFNIKTKRGTFKSFVEIFPQERVAGLGITYKHRISYRFWWEVSFPVVKVEHTLNFNEKIIDDGGGPVDEIGIEKSPRVGSMEAAFAQPKFRYGKFFKGSLTRKGVADVEIKVGYNSCMYDRCHLSSYLGVLVPTGNRPDGKYVFQPIVGNGHNPAILYGTNIGFELWQNGKHQLLMELDSAFRYIFSNRQRRSFDVIDKQWSRYMEVYRSKLEAEIAGIRQDANGGFFGINIFTQCVRVHPRFTSNVTTAFVYRYSKVAAELGYNFFVRQAEKVTLKWEERPAFEDIKGMGFTNKARTIRDNFACCPVEPQHYTSVKKRDLYIDSAAHPCAVSNSIYATLGIRNDDCRFPFIIGFGGSYEFALINTAINRWVFWGKLGISF